jgi:hypothetical protein
VAGVAGCRLEQMPSRLELAGSFSRLDHRLRDAILDRSGRILTLELAVDLDRRLRRDPRQLHEWCVADQVEQ